MAAFQAKTLAAWDQISDYDTTEQPLKQLAYTQGHHLIGYISDRWARKVRNDWLRAVAGGRTVDQATSEFIAAEVSAPPMKSQMRVGVRSTVLAPSSISSTMSAGLPSGNRCW